MRAWPGLISNRSLVIPIAAGHFADVRGRLTVAGVDLEAKREFHVTVSLYSAGDPRGIGLASEAQFAERRVMRVQAGLYAGNA